MQSSCEPVDRASCEALYYNFMSASDKLPWLADQHLDGTIAFRKPPEEWNLRFRCKRPVAG